MREKYRQKDWEAEKRAREICGGRDLLKDWRLMMSHRVVVRQTLSPFFGMWISGDKIKLG